ncbi:PKHS1 protein, partial [Heliornis fulica]|nr:PKHS1 protein [Heliornis fulica]
KDTFYPEGGVCKHGFLIKSPPLQLLGSQNSWKKRFFILSKSINGNYILKYLKGQNIKGSIALDQILSIEVGISNSEVMEMVKKMFKCLPEEVMSISTGKRCYYLIGSSRQEAEDWVTVISSVCEEAKRGGCCPQAEYQPRECWFCHTIVCKWPSQRKLTAGEASLGVNFFFFIQENGPTEDKNRPNSDPGPPQAQCDSQGGVFTSLDKNLGKSEDILLSSDTDEDSKKDKEDYYQTPSSILAKVAYQLLLDENCQLTCRCDGLPSLPKCQDNSTCPRDLEASRDLQLPESSTSKQPTLQRSQNSLPLSVVQLSILLNQVTDKTQLQQLEIFVPLTDIDSYLKLTEAAGQI